ncbi:hypothetical protein D1631_16115 [Chryseobacterium nematophagum]|uniref:Uncharacterized protein n=1 Tax=Chryseobacterium nematophagum TaxID=2305228 RepID=A0A3M7TM59_9FLAO|nr:hypothetical protein [Chryseobacterium nematophagum]RNA63340.1 hypothetical protein D1631_16115 [Chryseobacterium nematophagum]
MKLFYIIFFLFFSLPICSQNYSSKWYDSDDILLQSSIKDIIKDRYGFIWFMTDSGVLRYDGKNFLPYKTNKAPLRDFLGNVKKDSIIMFNHSFNSAFLLSERNFKEININNIDKKQLPENTPTDERVYKNTFLNQFYPNIESYYIKTNSGTYYFNNNQIEYKKEGTSKKEIIKNNFHYKSLKHLFTHEDYVYIVDPKHRKTMVLYKGKISYENTPNLYNDPESKIYWNQTTGQVFIINRENIYISHLIKDTPTLQFLVKYGNVEREFATAMFYDEEYNKLYFATLTRGLNVLTLSSFYNSQKKIPFANEVVYGAVPFSKSSVLTAEGIEYFKTKTKTVFPFKGLDNNRIIIYDSTQNILYKVGNKIQRRYKKSGYLKRDSISFPNKDIRGIYRTEKENIITFFDNRNGMSELCLFNDDSYTYVKQKKRFPFPISTIINVDSKFLYVGCDDGLYLYSIEKNKIEKKLVTNISVKEIIKDYDGNFWFTTYGQGIYLLKNNNILKCPMI